MSKTTRDGNDETAAVGDVDVRSHELFVDLVRRMRVSQRCRLDKSDRDSQRESKKLEREVDNWLEPFDGRIP